MQPRIRKASFRDVDFSIIPPNCRMRNPKLKIRRGNVKNLTHAGRKNFEVDKEGAVASRQQLLLYGGGQLVCTDNPFQSQTASRFALKFPLIIWGKRGRWGCRPKPCLRDAVPQTPFYASRLNTQFSGVTAPPRTPQRTPGSSSRRSRRAYRRRRPAAGAARCQASRSASACGPSRRRS